MIGRRGRPIQLACFHSRRGVCLGIPAHGDSARRGRRRPPGAHGAAVAAARRLHCGTRAGVVPRNSLRALRALRSDRRGKNDHEARCARRPRCCVPRHRTNRPCRVPPAARVAWECAWEFLFRVPRAPPRRRCGAGRDAPAGRRGGQQPGPARASAPRGLTRRRCPNAARDSARSELCAVALAASTAGQSAQPTASPKRRGLSRTGFADTVSRAQNKRCDAAS